MSQPLGPYVRYLSLVSTTSFITSQLFGLPITTLNVPQPKFILHNINIYNFFFHHCILFLRNAFYINSSISQLQTLTYTLTKHESSFTENAIFIASIFTMPSSFTTASLYHMPPCVDWFCRYLSMLPIINSFQH